MSSVRPPGNPPHGMPPQIVKIEKETTFGTPLSPLPFLAFDDAPLDPTLVIPPGLGTDLTECLFEAGDQCAAGDMMTDAFTGERVPLREAWTCPETGWYVYANGAYAKVADADD